MRASTAVLSVLAIAAGTWMGFPTMAPVAVGALLGLGAVQRPALTGALAGLAGWGLLLGWALSRGDDLGNLSTSLAGAMGLPAWAPAVATLAYPVVLASSAAWLAHLVSPWKKKAGDSPSSSPPSAAP